jgi:hypothetical protein
MRLVAEILEKNIGIFIWSFQLLDRVSASENLRTSGRKFHAALRQTLPFGGNGAIVHLVTHLYRWGIKFVPEALMLPRKVSCKAR